MEVVGRTILLFILAAASLLKVEGQGTTRSDHYALKRLRTSVSDPRNVLSSWDPNAISPCTWEHVTCNNFNRVIRLDLQSCGLFGALVTELGNLDQLQYLNLQNNMLNGKIPASLGNLKNLIDMNLGENSFGYDIPPFGSNLQSLQFLRVQNNKLSGQIPNSLTTIPKLTVL
ncbi:Leucine-rich repeat protein 1 [Linum perenne]